MNLYVNMNVDQIVFFLVYFTDKHKDEQSIFVCF